MNTDTIIRLLTNSGLYNVRADSYFVYVEDPSCILRSFEVFMHYAWIAIVVITGLLLFGWALVLIRGAKYDSIFTNIRNLVLIFGILSAAPLIVNFIYGDNLIARGCDTIKIPIQEVNEMLEMRKEKLGKNDEADMYEEFDIYDSGVKTEMILQ